MRKRVGIIKLKDEVINAYLKDIKKFIAKNGIQIAPREKNIRFMRENGLLLKDVKEIIMSLKPQDYLGGPEKDQNDKYEGDVWKFKNSTYLDAVIYIKIRYNPPKEVVCISFHQDDLQKEGLSV